MPDQHDDQSRALQGAKQKRIELKQALSQVENAAASPSADAAWRTKLLTELEKLRQALLDHVDEVEADDGLLNEMLSQAPRLANRIESVRDEHPELCERVDQAILDVRGETDVIDLRAEVLDTLSAIARHRQRGSDLVYEGYNIDIGGN